MEIKKLVDEENYIIIPLVVRLNGFNFPMLTSSETN